MDLRLCWTTTGGEKTSAPVPSVNPSVTAVPASTPESWRSETTLNKPEVCQLDRNVCLPAGTSVAQRKEFPVTPGKSSRVGMLITALSVMLKGRQRLR